MDKLVERGLGQAGLDYVLNHLDAGNVLCTTLRELVSRTEGAVSTIAPEDVDARRLLDFQSGGLLLANREVFRGHGDGQDGAIVPVVTLASRRAFLIQAAMQQRPGAICLVDDVNPRWSEPLAREPATAFGVGEEVYHLLTGEAGVDTIEAVLETTDTICHGAAAVCESGLQIGGGRKASADDLRQCAASAAEISCTAYDSEGFVVWRRT